VITKSLNDNRFFDAHHKLILKNETIISETAELEDIIKTEKARIFSDDALMKRFEKIDTAITKNVDLKTFKRVLEANPAILTEITNYESFKKKLWINYFSNFKESFNSLLEEYHGSQDEINKIIEKANSQRTEWENVVSLFNNRFDVPFKLKVLNQDDVILKEKTTPRIAFTYNDGRDELDIEEDSIKLKSFSTGERRALYLLNVIFEIEAKKKEGKECLIIFDDIADSFDYKNKYAIIEYLKDISEDQIFKMILLTHNFDFYRTVASRLSIIHRGDCFMTIKYDDEVKITPGNYLKNVFNSWVKELEKNQSIFIASIPFARNLIEYIKGEDDLNYSKLTNLLHIKSDTKTISTSDLSEIYNTIWTDKSFNYPVRPVYDLIIEEAERIVLDTSETVQLGNKIILSISIRLLAEELMIKKITNSAAVSAILKRQTTELMKLYKAEFFRNIYEIKLFEQVNLMSAENIHINAFMYEPILDLSDKHLKDIYIKIKNLS
jgi:energy-coupling factor transporter ATP-binding protein EcfA2